jgi:D-alanyl-D-alanine dipeptidase
MKPYQTIPIHESDEPLVSIPLDRFAVIDPHPYQAIGAPYGDRTPFWVRAGVLDRLDCALETLQAECPGWGIQIFDAFRPLPVQQFMVERAIAEIAIAQNLNPNALSDADRDAILPEVQTFWAIPSSDPATPPPHSTGGAIDVTLVNTNGEPINMGSPIDELSLRSYPDHFARSDADNAPAFHQRRQLLQRILTQAGFAQHPNEWWHFSYGDQMWAWLSGSPYARYGRAPGAL